VSSPNDSAPDISLVVGVGEQSKQLLNGPVGLFSALNLGVFIQGTLFPLTKAISHIAFKTGSTWRVFCFHNFAATVNPINYNDTYVRETWGVGRVQLPGQPSHVALG
jgi:hypothetical protein